MVYSLILSSAENLINISSCVLGSPIVISVPKWIKCLVVGEIKVVRVAVGLFVVKKVVVVVDALVVNLAAIPAFQVNVLPFNIVATRTCPKELSDQRPGSNVTVDASTALPNPVKLVAFWTTALVLCAWPFDVPGVAVPFVPLVIPKNCVEFFDVYVINSFAIAIVPADGKSVVESTVTAVPDPPVPAVSALSDPFNSVCTTPVIVPP